MRTLNNTGLVLVKRSSLAIISSALLLIMGLVLSGCMVGPDFTKPKAKVNENWNEKGDPRLKTQGAIDSRWWKTFNDPTLDNFIQVAHQQNLSLQIAGLRILESRAILGIAIGQQYPQQQEVFGSATRVGISKNAPNAVLGDRRFWDYQLGFDAAWELDFWGKFRRDVQAARASLAASVADYDNALVSLTAEVARTYTQIRTSEVLIQLTRENVRIQDDGLHIAESRFRNGATTELDVVQARTLLESTKTSIPQLETELQQAQNALSTLLGEPTGAVQEMLNKNKGIPTAPAEVAISLPAELLRRRPDIRSAEYYALAQSARIGVAKANLYPSFSLVGEIGFQTSSQGGPQSNNAKFDNLFDGSSLFYSIGPGFNWPIFNYGRIKNNVRLQDSIYQQQLVNYQNIVLRAAQEAEDALTGFLRAQETAVFAQNAVQAAQRSVEIATSQYREGAVDFQRVLDSQRSLLQEQTTLAQARSSISTNLIALYKALGGGWEIRERQPLIPESMQSEMQQRTDWGRMLPLQPNGGNTNQTLSPVTP